MASNADLIVEMYRKQKTVAFPGTLGNLPYDENPGDSSLLVRGKQNDPLIEKSGFGQSLLSGKDRRTEVTNASAVPWRMICSLEITASDNEQYIGTGWIAGPRLILTAGHCVFEKDNLKGWATSIKVFPGRSTTIEADKYFTATQFKAPDKWINMCDENFDYGAIILDHDISVEYGNFSVSTYPDSELLSRMVNISGYPFSRVGETQMHHRNRVNSVSPTKLYYDVDTEGGQSGSPIWIYEDQSTVPTVVGIHSYGAGKVSAGNSGVRITEEIVEFIEKWRDF